jgi:hypothetical protein
MEGPGSWCSSRLSKRKYDVTKKIGNATKTDVYFLAARLYSGLDVSTTLMGSGGGAIVSGGGGCGALLAEVPVTPGGAVLAVDFAGSGAFGVGDGGWGVGVGAG